MPRATFNEYGFNTSIYVSKNLKVPPTLRFGCQYCGETVSRKSDIPRHMERHLGIFKFMCDKPGCREVGAGVGFRQLVNLKTHWENAHGPDNKFPCPHVWIDSDGIREDCPARFTCKKELSRHRGIAHGYKKSDDDSKAKDNPTPVGTVFASEGGGSWRGGRGRRAVSEKHGAFIPFLEGCSDDNEAGVNFVLETFADTEELKRTLESQGVPFPVLQFKWPKNSGGGRETSSRSARNSTPSSSSESTANPTPTPTPSQDLEHHHQIAATLAATQAVYAQHLPYPLTANAPTLPAASNFPTAVNDLGQQDVIHDAAPPPWSPTLFQPFASSSAIPQPQPAPAPVMTMASGSMAPPQLANQAYGLADPFLSSLGWPLPLLQQFHGTQMSAHQTGGPMGPMPPPQPSHRELGLGDFSYGTTAISRTSQSFNEFNGFSAPVPLYGYGAEGVAMSRTAEFLSVVATAPAPVPAAEPGSSQAPLDLSGFLHWSMRLGPPAP